MVALNVLAAYMLINQGLVYLSTNDENHYRFNGTIPTSEWKWIEWKWISQNVFDSTVGFPDRIAL